MTAMTMPRRIPANAERVHRPDEPSVELPDDEVARVIGEVLGMQEGGPEGPLEALRFHLSLNDDGVVVLTCPEVPALMVLGDTEEEAVTMATEALQMRSPAWLGFFVA